MTKVKLYKEVAEEHPDIEYPVYLYFQDENCLDTFVMVDENRYIEIEYSQFGLEITLGRHFRIQPHYLVRNATTKDIFDREFDKSINYLKINNQ